MVNFDSDLTSRGLAPESAVVAFWKLLEPAQSGGASSPNLAPYPQQQGKVHDLPTELLLIIFKLAEPCSRWMEDDINSPALFPYAIAAVCTRWRDVMSLIPEFWTRVVIVLDMDVTTPPETVLSWSRNLNLPLDVVITRIDFDHSIDSWHEWDQVTSIMKTLVHSHANRSRKLHFNVRFSSSLPAFPDSFRGAWNTLSELFLSCHEDTGRSDSTDIWELISPTEQPLGFPTLKSLIIDGRNYYEACSKNFQWTVMCPSVSQLAISHYTPFPGDSLWTTLPSFGTLRVNDVSIPRSPSTLPLLPLQVIQFSHIHEFTLISEILHRLLFNVDIVLTRCVIGSPREHFNWQGRLTLRDIDGDLIPLLSRWEGEALKVDNCPGFNDSILDMMGMIGTERVAEQNRYSCAPRMHHLFINNCPSFSAEALKRFVNRRLGVLQASTYTDMYNVSITGSAPYISAQDQQQLSRYVPNFNYFPL